MSYKKIQPNRPRTIWTLFFANIFASTLATAQTDEIEQVLVVGSTPGGGLGQAVNDLPFGVRSANQVDLEKALSLDLTDYLNQRLGSVNINSAQNNPLQPDVQFRGFTASPLLGLPQGISVYQNGVRINEPLGDSVNWDLLPESAINRIDLISGANPLFGLNTLGGALVVDMKNGFNFEGSQLDISSGSWGRETITLESGGNVETNGGGSWGYYVNFDQFEEDGWRDLSESEATNFYGSIGWRKNDSTALNINYQQGNSDLRGNGAAPVGLLAIDRSEIFTAPDVTENDATMLSIDGSHFISNNIQLVGSAFIRKNDTDSFNGDGSEFELCEYSGGTQSLFEEADDIEDALEDDLDIELDDICEGGDPSITNFGELESFIETEALANSFDPEDYELEDVADEVSGTGILSDEAINNISNRVQESRGFDGKINFLGGLFGFLPEGNNRLTIGISYLKGESTFDSVLELSDLDPITRSTQGLGTGAFVDEAETSVKTSTETTSLFFSNTMDLNERWTLTLAGRYNDSDITLRDRSGERPELNGDHNFSRFNPSVGFTYNPTEAANWYGSYSESNRVPTPIELACNEGVFEVARQFAIADGEDPDDIEFECRLPNAFLADPPLDDVVTKNIEFGMRGDLGLQHDSQPLQYQVGFFRAINHDDILFQTTGRATGLFANVNKTQRLGIEMSINGRAGKLQWFANASHIRATFEDSFDVLSPNHPNANEEGVIPVQSGDRIPGIPETLIKFGGDFNFTENFSVGADAIYNSDQVLRGDESNDMGTVDGYIIANLRASYTLGDSVTLYARVTNIFDEEYENFGLLGEEPDEVIEDLDDERPIFLGAGAPRGAWLGLRIRF